jgi:hypothetical protein
MQPIISDASLHCQRHPGELRQFRVSGSSCKRSINNFQSQGWHARVDELNRAQV